MELSDLSRDERSLLLYVEARAVDHTARMNVAQLNRDDRDILDRWNDTGFVISGRICAEDAESRDGSLWCRLSDEAWRLAHEERKARGGRLWEKRGYQTTEEARGEAAREPSSA